jgi:hypothetical protein
MVVVLGVLLVCRCCGEKMEDERRKDLVWKGLQ